MWQTIGLWMLLVWVLAIAAIVAGVVLIGRAVRGSAGDNPERDHTHALGILEERFARGEIDRHEFEERRRALGP